MLQFNLNRTLEILERTPVVLENLLFGLSEEWLYNNEGKKTWSPYDVLGHLIVGEKTDWLVRVKIILKSDDKHFRPFDRFAQFNEEDDREIGEMLEEFKTLRFQNLQELNAFHISENDLKQTGIHPEFGTVTLSQLITTWGVHDLGHIAQISRVMAFQHKNEVGPWISYLGILKK
ncbi:MAG: hypothetical protein CML04_10125 [Pseudozobellia sp.]|nr:hypothetical protein [Pseudozobellia sp.]MBG47136.1 hypothetical protein [Pseudozobellia sp.]|tara:strand:- start:28 stop:552 length:525 start_codon:yes stop_codon:yes gene_type:complete